MGKDFQREKKEENIYPWPVRIKTLIYELEKQTNRRIYLKKKALEKCLDLNVQH